MDTQHAIAKRALRHKLAGEWPHGTVGEISAMEGTAQEGVTGEWHTVSEGIGSIIGKCKKRQAHAHTSAMEGTASIEAASEEARASAAAAGDIISACKRGEERQLASCESAIEGTAIYSEKLE